MGGMGEEWGANAGASTIHGGYGGRLDEPEGWGVA